MRKETSAEFLLLMIAMITLIIVFFNGGCPKAKTAQDVNWDLVFLK